MLILRALLAFLTITVSIHAQSESIYSSIVGNVTDASGAAVPGATVAATNVNTNIRVSASSAADEQGHYRIERLVAGSYVVTAERAGFKKFVREGVTVSAAQSVRVEIPLEIGQLAETVTVSGGITLIQTETPEISAIQTWDVRKYLPTSTPNLFSTLALEPGTVTSPNAVTYAGSRMTEYDYSINGSTIRGAANGANVTVGDTNEWQQEVRTSYVNNDAENPTLAQVDVTTKSGGNAFHGSGVYYYTSGGLQGRSPFSPTRPSGVDQKAAGSLGGHIVKDRSFFFVSYAADRNHSGVNNTSTVPSANMRQGNLTEIAGNIVDPTNGAPFPNKIIPTSRISPVSAAFIDRFFPLPNFGSSFSAGNYRTVVPQAPADDNVFGRVDHRFSDRHSIFGSYVYDESNRGGIFTASIPTVGYREGYRRDQNVIVSDLFTINPHMFNEVSAGWTRDHNLQLGSILGPDVEKLLGLQGVNVLNYPMLPQMNIAGLTTPTISTTSGSYQDVADETYFLRDNVSWISGKHRMKAGLLVTQGRDARVSPEELIDGFFGSYTFSNNFATGAAFGDFLLGIPQSVSRLNADSFSRGYLRRNTYQAFAQDEFQVGRSLTLSYGIRFEHYQPFLDHGGRTYTFDPANGAIVVPNSASLSQVNPQLAQSFSVLTAQQANFPGRLQQTDALDLAPRVGIAWRPMAQTVVRAGYGIFYDYNLPILSDVAPFVPNQSFAPNKIVNGVPTYQFPNPFTGSPLGLGTLSLIGGAYHLATPYSQQWSLTLERQLTSDTAVRATYVGTRGLKEGYQYNLNVPQLSTTVFTQASRPYPQYGPVMIQDNGAANLYQALLVRAEHRAKGGLYFSSGFTWAKDTGEDVADAFTTNSPNSVLDPFNRALDKGNISYIRRLQWISIVNWQVPGGHPHSRFMSYLTGNWQMSGILNLSSGQYLTPTYSGYDSSGTGNLTNRPDRIGDGNLPSGQRSVNEWFNTAAFTAPGASPATPLVAPSTPIGRFGNSGTGIIEGPGLWQFDLSLVKGIPVTERLKANLFFLGTNVFNHPNLGNPNMVISSPVTAGHITGITTDGNASGIGMRLITLGVRFEF